MAQSNSEDFYEGEAVKKAIVALIDALNAGENYFSFESYEVDPRAYYLKYSPTVRLQAVSSDVILGFDKLFFYDSKSIPVKYGIDKYAIINCDFTISYLTDLVADALDLAYISRCEKAFEFYLSVISGLYYNKKDIDSLTDLLRFKEPSNRFDLIRDLPEHNNVLKPVFPEDLVINYIQSINKVIKEEYMIQYNTVKPVLYQYWLSLPDLASWDPSIDLEVVLFDNVFKIRSRNTGKILF